MSHADYVVILKAMADETRLKIIDMLTEGELCACKILESVNITQPTLSYHMKILSESGLVDARRDGAWMRYTLNKESLDITVTFLAGLKQKADRAQTECCDNC